MIFHGISHSCRYCINYYINLHVHQCCLGVDYLNPNVAGEMAQLLMNDQEKYVPILEKDGRKILLQSVFFDGDQLTEERARNVQWTFQDGDDSYDRLEGLDPAHADWHAKVNLYEVNKFVRFLLTKSA